MDRKCRTVLTRAIRRVRDANDYIAHGNDVSILLAKRGRCRLRDGTRERVWDGRRRVTPNLTVILGRAGFVRVYGKRRGPEFDPGIRG